MTAGRHPSGGLPGDDARFTARPGSEAMAERRPPRGGGRIDGAVQAHTLGELALEPLLRRFPGRRRVAVRYLSGSDRAMVRHDLRYCSRNEPVV